jgi:protein subunit release factor B
MFEEEKLVKLINNTKKQIENTEILMLQLKDSLKYYEDELRKLNK